MVIIEFVGTIVVMLMLPAGFFLYDRWKAQKRRELIFFLEYNSSFNLGKSAECVADNSFLAKKAKRLMKIKKERDDAYDNYKKAEAKKEKEIAERRNLRKMGYKYEDEIFEIFRFENYLAYDQLLNGIQNVCRLNVLEATDRLRLWEKNYLICKNYDNKKYNVGFVLTSSMYSIDKDDITFQKWLKNNGIDRNLPDFY